MYEHHYPGNFRCGWGMISSASNKKGQTTLMLINSNGRDIESVGQTETHLYHQELCFKITANSKLWGKNILKGSSLKAKWSKLTDKNQIPLQDSYSQLFLVWLALSFKFRAWASGKVTVFSCRPFITQLQCCNGCLSACPPDAVICVRAMDFQCFIFLLPSNCQQRLRCSSPYKVFAHAQLHSRKLGTKLNSY